MGSTSVKPGNIERVEDRGARPPALIPHFIGGERQSGRTGRTALVFNPSTGQASGRVVLGTRHDVDDAVSSGMDAFAEWSSWSPLKRARVMFRFRELLESHATDLATIIANEHGKVLGRRPGRGTARHRGRGVRLRHPAPAQG